MLKMNGDGDESFVIREGPCIGGKTEFAFILL